MSKEFLYSILHNRILLFNIIVITAVITFLLIANIQQEADIEEYATVPYDHTPVLTEVNEYTGNVEVIYDKDTFQIDYRVFRFKDNPVVTHVSTEESKPLPMSPATTVFYLYNDTVTTDRAWLIAVAVKKITDEPAVYMLKVNDRTVAYFSDPFPTGYNSLVIYSPIYDMNSAVKIEINRVRTLS